MADSAWLRRQIGGCDRHLRIPTIATLIGYGRRELLRFAVTRHATAEWLAQQIVGAFPWDTAGPGERRQWHRIDGALVLRLRRAVGKNRTNHAANTADHSKLCWAEFPDLSDGGPRRRTGGPNWHMIGFGAARLHFHGLPGKQWTTRSPLYAHAVRPGNGLASLTWPVLLMSQACMAQWCQCAGVSSPVFRATEEPTPHPPHLEPPQGGVTARNQSNGDLSL